MESTIGLYRTELITLRASGRNWPGLREVERETAEWVRWYNHERIHSSIDYITPRVEAFLHTGITNAASEGINRVIKLEARNAYGFRNPVNQRLRSRCASIRAARGPAKPG